jgi:hypothetical protein
MGATSTSRPTCENRKISARLGRTRKIFKGLMHGWRCGVELASHLGRDRDDAGSGRGCSG